jgi:hypothetical protein
MASRSSIGVPSRLPVRLLRKSGSRYDRHHQMSAARLPSSGACRRCLGRRRRHSRGPAPTGRAQAELKAVRASNGADGVHRGNACFPGNDATGPDHAHTPPGPWNDRKRGVRCHLGVTSCRDALSERVSRRGQGGAGPSRKHPLWRRTLAERPMAIWPNGRFTRHDRRLSCNISRRPQSF